MNDYIHKEFPKTCAPDDFFGQVKRTVNGKPVSQEQIDIIIASIRNNLGLAKQDILLDVCAGNGALAKNIFPEIKAYLGVDFSEYLIEVAQKNFEKLPDFKFRLSDALEYVKNEDSPSKFTKGLCYGAFQYLSYEAAEQFLKILGERFKNIQIFFIGNLPDKDRAHLFYPKDKDFSGLLNDNSSPLGIWRTKAEMLELAEKTGWHIEIIDQQKEFYSAHYRYDAKLTRK